MKKKLVTVTAVWIAAFATTSRVAAQELGAPPTPAEPALPGENPPPAVAENPTAPAGEGKTIKSIDVRFKGAAAVDRDRILSNMSLKVGEKYSTEKEEADIKRLYGTGDVDNIIISTEDVAGGVRVIVTVEGRAGLGDVTFLGNSEFTADRLRKEIDLKVGATVEDAKLQEASRTIEELYRKKGFSDVTVNYTVEPAGNGFSRITFKIDEGQRGYLRDVIFEGNSSISAKELKKVMKADNRGIKFWTGPKLEQEKLDADVRAIEEYYQNRGYVNARVTGYERVRVDAKKVDLMVRISEGQQFTVKSVSVSGMKAYNPEEFIPAFDLESGKLFSGANMKSDIQKIKTYYGSRGYAEVKVTPQIKEAGGNEISVVYAIEEGSTFSINKISFSGNEATKDEVMRREMAIHPGDQYNQTTIDVSELRLKKLGYFKEVTVIPSDAETPGYKDLSISVTEGQTGQLNFGAGFSSIDNLVGFISLRESNFDFGWPPKGAGQRLNIDVKVGTKRKDINIGWYEPWLFGRPLGFGVEGFFTEKTYLSDVYDQTNMGGDIYFRKRLNEFSDWRLQLLAEQVKIDGIDANASEAIKSEGGSFFHSEASLTYNFDSRDDNVLPRRGMKFSAEGSLAFGDFEDYGLALNFSKPVLLPWDLIFTVNASYETVEEMGGGRVPIFERVFLGGANNLRGFEYRDVGPKDETGEALGGKSAWYIGGELTVPVIERVRLAGFLEAGGVDTSAFGGGNMNGDYGFGLRLNLPVLGPLRLDYGIPFEGDEFNDSGGRFNISVDYKY